VTRASPRRTPTKRPASGLVAGLLAVAVAAFAGGAHGADADWPAHPIRIVVAQAPGGPPDLIGRFVAERLARGLGSPVVVDNRPGASGIIGVEQVARSLPDGHTLLIATMSTHVLVPLVSAKVPYDAVGDFVPVSNLFRTIKALWVNAALPPRSLREFVDYAAARPGQLNYATGGVGSSNHVDAAWFVQAAGLDLVHVPYNGPAAAIAAVAGGDAQMMVVSITTGLPLAQGGRVRPLAVFGDRRAALLPGVPTAAEQGMGAVDLAAWIGLMAPAGTPPDVVERLNALITRILREPETVEWADRQGMEIAAGSRADFARTLERDRQRWGEFLGRMRISPH
jgi:tripartite-type tricarboxylate transporter receptor subunit TctC